MKELNAQEVGQVSGAMYYENGGSYQQGWIVSNHCLYLDPQGAALQAGPPPPPDDGRVDTGPNPTWWGWIRWS